MPQCLSDGCLQQASWQCSKLLCGSCCNGCNKHPRKLPPPGEPGSCECGQVASPSCDNLLCASCCPGCTRHASSNTEPARPQPGQPGSCDCGQVASPNCQHLLCGTCCNGCYYHGYDHASDTASSESCHYRMPVGAQPGQPGSCRCGQIASPACDYSLCANCCNGCSRHADAASPAPVAPPVPVGPQPGEPGSCGCGNVASPACDYLLCANCCNGCSRHADADSESDQVTAVLYEQIQQQLLRCACGQLAPRECASSSCFYCCPGPCSWHFDDINDFYGTEDLEEPIEPPRQQQQQQIFCRCGRPAAAACTRGNCLTCCSDPYCRRHYPAATVSSSQPQQATSRASMFSGLNEPTGAELEIIHTALSMFRDFFEDTARATGTSRGAAAAAPAEPVGAAGAVAPQPCTAIASGAHLIRRPAAANSSSISRPNSSSGAARAAGSVANTSSSGSSGLSSSSSGAARAAGSVANTSSSSGGPSSSSSGAARAAGSVANTSSSSGGPSSSSSGAARAAGPSSSANASSISGDMWWNTDGQRISADEALHQLKHCIVCLDEPRSVLLLPCKHLVLCGSCSNQLRAHARAEFSNDSSNRQQALCPVCRVPAAQHMHGVILS